MVIIYLIAAIALVGIGYVAGIARAAHIPTSTRRHTHKRKVKRGPCWPID